MLSLFRKKLREPTTPKPTVGDWRIVRKDRQDGRAIFCIERYVGRWEHPSIFAIPDKHWYRGCCTHDTQEAAQAMLDKFVAYWRESEVVAETVVSTAPANPTPRPPSGDHRSGEVKL